MTTRRILIVAPEPDFRRSLRFAIEAEGYAVDEVAGVAYAPRAIRYDCTVLDRKATTGPSHDIIAFCRQFEPVVLLSERGPAWLEGAVATAVERPVPGLALISAIAAAIAAGPGTTTT